MKRILMTAAALMFSTSALAWAPVHDKGNGAGVTATGMKSSGMQGAKIADDMGEMGDMGWSGEKMAGDMASMKLAGGTAKAGDGMDDMAWSGGKTYSETAWGGEKTIGDMAGMKLASGSAKLATDGGKIGDMGDMGMAETDMSWSGKGEATMASASDAGPWAGQGGPMEDVQAYPACSPGRGDDRCIQLYETGGRKNLMASAGDTPLSRQLAMGGPFEPAASASGKTETPAAEDHSAHGAAAPAAGAKPTTDEGPEDENFVEDTATPPAGKPEMAEATGGTVTKAMK